jgi:DNA-binding SARP family transcriptional activator/TolB-like protein
MVQRGRPALVVQILGPFHVSVLGKAVGESQWTRPQAKLLVKLLAIEPKHQLHRQQIIAAIWPELPGESGAANLHKIIHMARRALEPKLKSGGESRFILTRDQQVRLAAAGGLWIDAEEFDAASVRAFRSGLASDCEAALALYGGDLLSEDLYADWFTRRRDQLRALQQEISMKLASLYAAQGQHKDAIVQFERLVAAEPSNEEAHRDLMRLYTITGRRSEALRQFKRCCDAVRAELDAEPEEATHQLYRKILAREVRALPQTGVSLGREASIDTIAVLPFHNDTGDSSLTYLSSGIAESLIKNLSHLPRLRVLAYSTVARYKGRDLNPRRLGRQLMVRALSTGRLVKVDGALVIIAELVDTSDGSILWGEHYRPRQTDVLEVQEEMSQEISEKLKLQLTVDERKQLVKHYTADPEAYTSYLKGRFYWNKRTSEGLRKAIDHFQQAIEKDPSYALAYSGLADCYNLLSLYGVMAPKKAMPQAKAAARKALKIDDSLAEAHTSLAYAYLYFDWNWPDAESEFQRAIELNPNYATAHHWYHEYLIAMGRFEEQMAEILHAEELDPVSLIINTDVGWGLYYARRNDQAIEQLRRTLELDANFGIAHLMLGLAYAQKHCLGEALASVQRSIELSAAEPFTLALGALGYIYAISGRRSAALSAIEQMKQLAGARYASDYCQALVLAGLGDRTGAINRLESALEQRYDRLIYLNVEPIFDGLRDDPRFQSVIRRIGL